MEIERQAIHNGGVFVFLLRMEKDSKKPVMQKNTLPF